MKPIFRRAAALGLAAALLLLSGCSKKKDEGVSSAPVQNAGGQALPDTLRLPFSANDLLNPYEAATKINQELSLLLFDPLVKLDSSFSPVYCLAERIELDGKDCTIDLKEAQFTDGSPVTAEDVTYSIGLALESNTRYKQQLAGISSRAAADTDTVVLELKEADPYFVNLLDFPIVKLNSTSREDENNRALPPLGCGRYTLEETDAGAYRLVRNEDYYGQAPAHAEITLIDSPDWEALSHTIEVGGIDMYYSDLRDNEIPKMTGKSVDVPLTDLVYLGVNHKHAALGQIPVRQALSAALSRDKIADVAYYNQASPATGLFPPGWAPAADLQAMPPAQNIDEAVAYLEQAGYNRKDQEGYCVNTAGERIALRLLYNSENTARATAAELIVQQLHKCGVEVIPQALSFSQYQEALKAGQFDLYLGEVRLLANMDVRAMFDQKAGACYGLPKTTSSGEAFEKLYEGESELSVALSEFGAELPFIPVCYRSGMLAYTAGLSGTPSVSMSDVYYGIDALSLS